MPPDTAPEVDLLGPLVLRVGGHDTTPTRGRVRQVLAVLALAAGPVSADRLVEELWGARPPDDPRSALRVVVSRLRQALGDSARSLVHDGGGYDLRARRVDAVEFEALVHEARSLESPARRLELLVDALDLWRGDPVVDVPMTPGLELRRHELVALQSAAVTEAAELASAAGDHAAALALTGRVAAPPVADERWARIRAGALAGLGRRAEALAVLGALRRELGEVYGLEPSPPTRALEREILEGSVDVGEQVPVTGRDPVPFVGRTRELEILEAAGAGETWVVTGPRGRGKSALARELAVRWRGAGRFVVTATASRTPGRPLEVAAALVDAAVAGSRSGPPDLSHRRIVDWLAGEGATSVGPAPTREGLIDGVAALLTGVGSPLAVIVDDAQWLDAVSGEVLEAVAGRGATVVVLARDGDAGHTGSRWVDAASAAARRLELDVLPDDDADRLVAATAPSLGDGVRRRLVSWCGGDPLFLVLLSELVAEGALVDEHLPASVLLVVRERLDALSVPARRTIEVAAVLGRIFPLSVLRRLRPAADAELDDARRAGLVERIDDRVARFRHELVRDAAYEMLGPGVRASLHDEIARLLESDGAPASEYVSHARAAAAVDPARALRVQLASAREHMEAYAWPVALEHLAAAEVLLDRTGSRGGPAELRLLLDRGRAQRLAHEPGSHESLKAALALAESLGDDDAFVAAVTELCDLGPGSGVGAVDSGLLDLLDRALRCRVRRARRLDLLLAGTSLLAFVDDVRARALYGEARALAAGDGDAALEVAVLMTAHLGLTHPDDLEHRRRAARRLAEVCGDDTSLAWEAAFLAYGVGLVGGDGALVDESIERMRELTHRVADRPRFFGMHFTEASYAHLRGDLDAAETHAHRAVEIGSRIYPASRVFAVFSGITMAVHTARGTRAEFAPLVEEFVAGAPESVTWRSVAAVVAADRGDHDTVRRHLEPVVAADFGSRSPDLAWTAVAVLAAQAVVAVQDRPAARRLAELLGPYSGRMSWDSVCAHGPIDAALARLAAVVGDGVAHERHRDRALALVGELGASASLWPWM